MTVLVQYTQTRHPAFPDVPAMVEFGKTDLDKKVLGLYGSTAEIGRSIDGAARPAGRAAGGASHGR